jgi:hypothetical protein
VLERAVRFIEEMHLAEVLDSEVEIVHMPHNEPSLADVMGDEE